MEILVVLLLVALVGLLVVQFAAGGTPSRRRRVDAGAEVGPERQPDPGQSRPAGPGAESQDASHAGTLHPPSQSPGADGGPDAEPPHRAAGTADPEGAGRRQDPEQEG